MKDNNNINKPLLLTNTELEWLLGNKQLPGSYHRKIKSQIRKKINNFENIELLPLLVEKGLISSSIVTKFGNGVIKCSNTENHDSY